MKDATQRNVAIAVVSVIILAVAGYFLLRSSEAKVSGVLTLDGQPVADAEIVFLLEGVESPTPIVARSDDNGKYKLVGTNGNRIPVGKYKVVVTKLATTNQTVLSGEKLVQARELGLLLNTLPPVYEDRSTTPLQMDVRRGSITLNLELKSQP